MLGKAHSRDTTPPIQQSHHTSVHARRLKRSKNIAKTAFVALFFDNVVISKTENGRSGWDNSNPDRAFNLRVIRISDINPSYMPQIVALVVKEYYCPASWYQYRAFPRTSESVLFSRYVSLATMRELDCFRRRNVDYDPQASINFGSKLSSYWITVAFPFLSDSIEAGESWETSPRYGPKWWLATHMNIVIGLPSPKTSIFRVTQIDFTFFP
ncbi:hypothetical protein IW262DRAFT_1301267 [Armillaria fumosa]|nr:hypothetical protein IW262DRAFT_1301267 [Armillaria fumosa]